MKLGINCARPTSFDTYRWFNNEAVQAEPWWTTDDNGWGSKENPRKFHRRPGRGTLYRSVISDNGAAGTGPFRFDADPGVELKGSYDTDLDGLIRPHVGKNLWLEFRNQLRSDFFPYATLHRPDAASKGNFSFEAQSDLAVFEFARLMDWTGAFSLLDSSEDYRSGDSGHLVPLSEDWFDHVGMRAELIRSFPAKKVWLNIPLLIAADPSKTIRWLEQRHKPGRQTMVSVGNELSFNWQFPRTAWLHQEAAKLNLHQDPNVARVILLLKLCERVHDTLEGFDEIQTVAELHNAGQWPAARKQWMQNAPVSAEVHRILKKLGNVAVAPYFANGSPGSTVGQLRSSMQEPLGDLRAWKQICDDLGVKLHIYEFGSHNHDAPAISQIPAMGQVWPEYLTMCEGILDPDAWAAIYALGGLDPWTLTPAAGVDSVKMTAVKQWISQQP